MLVNNATYNINLSPSIYGQFQLLLTSTQHQIYLTTQKVHFSLDMISAINGTLIIFKEKVTTEN